MSGQRFGYFWAVFAGCLLLPGCRAPDARSVFSTEFSCPEDDVTVKRISGTLYEARGCFATEMYHCDNENCVAEPDNRADLRPVTSPAAPSSAEPSSADAPVKKDKPKAPVVTLDLAIGNSALLKLRGLSEQQGVVHVYVTRNESDPELEQCQLEMMLDGDRLPLPKARFSRKSTLSSLGTKLPADFLGQLGSARQLAFRACNLRWSLPDEQIAEVHHFVRRYAEELAWSGDESTREAGAPPPPSGGWPAWKVSSAAPPAQGKVQEGEALFKLLAPSVFEVEALRPGGGSQGSAVAVSATELLTNCHVVARARKIIVKQQKKEWVVKLSRSAPKSDRCVLEMSEPILKPVGGVRPYADLKVGEPLYTLGSPSGFELTLSNGILSGLREEGGVRYVQTTAPISPGSSGGGLFDARGNLVGITTLVVIGRERVNQALNFAIAADSFWQK